MCCSLVSDAGGVSLMTVPDPDHTSVYSGTALLNTPVRAVGRQQSDWRDVIGVISKIIIGRKKQTSNVTSDFDKCKVLISYFQQIKPWTVKISQQALKPIKQKCHIKLHHENSFFSGDIDSCQPRDRTSYGGKGASSQKDSQGPGWAEKYSRKTRLGRDDSRPPAQHLLQPAEIQISLLS